MTTEPAQPAAPDTDAPATAPASATWQLWILLIWHPALGLPVDPVAVLGLDTRPDAPTGRVVRWVPLVYDAADPWRERLGESTTQEDIERWAAQSGVCAVEPAEVPDGALDLAHAADLVLDELLAEVIPALPPRGAL
ncbi:hypothetical protein ACFY1P_32755 [Streptomyces sp. NPDC001407]|uniref:hypothetical protein n=1 Tax=Streptomyces sp. NPDC001407 TaxID=3364573 RepID=UPI00367AC647